MESLRTVIGLIRRERSAIGGFPCRSFSFNRKKKLSGSGRSRDN